MFDLDSYTTNGVCDAPGTMRGLEGGFRENGSSISMIFSSKVREADVSRRDIFYFDAVNEGGIRFLDKNYIETGVQN